MVQRPGVNSTSGQYAPINASANAEGIVAYLDEGVDAIRNARREDALKQMFEACDGKYRILYEGTQESDPSYVTQGTPIGLNTYSVSSSHVYFRFSCA
jgi:hypothetical protein